MPPAGCGVYIQTVLYRLPGWTFGRGGRIGRTANNREYVFGECNKNSHYCG